MTTLEINRTYLGVSGKVGHDSKLVQRYNDLLKFLGTGGMLAHFEQFVDDQDLTELLDEVDNALNNEGKKGVRETGK